MKGCVRFLTFILTVMIGLIVFSGCGSDNANSDENDIGIEYILNNDGESYSISALEDFSERRFTIPSTYKRKSVITIYDNAFNNCYTLVSITIPTSIEYIGSYAFYRCDYLTTVNYEGTKEQWKKIIKSEDAFLGMKTSKVNCSDGVTNLDFVIVKDSWRDEGWLN